MSLLERDRGVFQVVPSEVVPSEVDTLLAKELNQLSFEDREKVYEDLHGVGKIENYGGQRLNDALQQMQVEIDKLEHKPGYDRALSVNSRYIFDRRLRTVFLYAVKLDPFKAALRMERFLQYSSHCFGSQALLRPIRYSDLSPNAVAMMKEGSGLLLPVRDTSGRRVLIVTKDIGEGSSLLDRQQMDLYLWQSFSLDEETSKKGLVLIVCIQNMMQNAYDREMKQWVDKLSVSAPGWFSAVHYVLPDRPLYHAISASYIMLMGKENRSRLRLHVGSPTEILYSLKTFGIPVDYLPHNLKRNCKVALKNHLKYVDMLVAKDQAEMTGYNFNTNPIVICPINKDILLGKGRQIMKHPGNVEMRHLLETVLSRWEEAADNQEKVAVAREVLKSLKASGSRFLAEHPNGWYVEVDDDTARQKISIGFRDMVKRKKRRIMKTPTPMQGKSHTDNIHAFSEESTRSMTTSQMQRLHSETSDFANLSEDSLPKRQKMSPVSDCFGMCSFCNHVV